MPHPRQGETREAYLSRCMGSAEARNDHPNAAQRYIVCQALWRDSHKRTGEMKTHEQLVAAIAARKGKPLTFGIKTADRYVATLGECVGPGMCQRYFGGDLHKSLGTLIKEAANKLTFAGADLEIEEKLATDAAMIKQIIGSDEMPEHTMMALTHVLTTPREDRDGDILLTEGAQPDENMPMLWQHVHTLPIGKAIKVIEHSPKVLKMASVLLDINDLTHDAGILLEAKALRFSHGFRALDFAERNKSGGMGFEVKSFEIMEESLVSVPSNVEAEIELLGKRKLKSEVFKAHAEFLKRNIRQKRSQHAGVEMPKVTYTEQVGDYKRTIKAGSFAELKEGLELVGVEKQTPPAEGHQHKGKPCGCGGKEAGKAVGGPPRDTFSQQVDADSRAEVLGCDGHHMVVGPGGQQMFRPCRNPDEYDTYAQGRGAPMLPKPTVTAAAKPAGEKVWMDGSSLSGSYLHRMTALQTDAQRFLMGAGMDVDVDDCVSVFALFDGYGILCVMEGFSGYEWGPSDSGMESYYQAAWSEADGEPKWTGIPTPVEVQASLNVSATAERHVATLLKIAGDDEIDLADLKFTVDTAPSDGAPKQNKVGRVISTANLQRLNDALDDLKHLRTLDIPREASAMIDRVLTTLGSVVDAASNGEDQQPKAAPQITAKEAAAIVLQCADAGLQRKLADALSGILRVYREDEKANEFKRLLRR